MRARARMRLREERWALRNEEGAEEGPRFVPEDGPAVVEEEGDVAGGRGAVGLRELVKMTERGPFQLSFGSRGQRTGLSGKEEFPKGVRLSSHRGQSGLRLEA